MRRILISTVLIIFLLGSAYAGERGIPRRYNPRQRVDLDLNGKNLGEVLAELKRKTGVDFIVGLDVARPEEFPRRVLYFDLRDLPLRHALDWIARALGTRYRVSANGKIITFTSSYRWLDQAAPIYNAIDLGMITTWEERDAFCLQVKELMKPYALGEPRYRIRVRTADYRLEVILPAELQNRLNVAFRAMLNPGRVPQRRNLRAARGLEKLQAALAKPVVLDYEGWQLQDIIADLSFQADLNIGFDHHPFWDQKLPTLTLWQRETTLAEALGEICARTPLRGWLLSPAPGLWLTTRAASQAANACRYTAPRELLWEEVPVLGYSVPLLARRLGEKKLLERVREMIPLDAATDPSVGVIYHARSGNLIVIAPEGVQEIVEDGLARLAAAPEASRP